jgi:hypothetical protein
MPRALHPHSERQLVGRVLATRSTAMSFVVVCGLNPHTRPTVLEESIMTATYTFDVVSALDELIESWTLDGNVQELIYRPTRHG